MTIGVRGKLFILFLLLLGVGLAASEVILVPRLEVAQLESERDSLTRLARTAADALAQRAGQANGADFDIHALACHLGKVMGVRVTFVRIDGVVVGESRFDREGLASMVNHGERPEVRMAMTGAAGSATRRSATTGDRLLYVAAPPTSFGVVSRVASPLNDIEAMVGRLRRSFRVAAGIGLLVAALLSSLAAHYAANPLRELEDVASALARRDFSQRADVRSNDELGALARGLNALSADLERTIGALTDERDLLDGILNGMTEGVLVNDADGRILRANPKAMELLSLAPEAIGRTVVESTRQPALAEHIEGVLHASMPAQDDIELAGTERRSVSVSSAPLSHDRGVVTTIHDVTELRRLERMRQDFVANVSHELRTPVATLEAAGETLLAGALDDPPRAREFTEMVDRNARRLARLVSDLLDLAKLDAGEIELDLMSIEPATVVSRTLESLAGQIESKGLEVRADIDPALTVIADPGALDQIITNLVDNAVKYTPAGGHVGIDTEVLGSNLRLTVWDTGSGIEPHHRYRVFERFYRVDPGRSRELGGTGLGLAIVKHLVEAMGGLVGVDGRVSGGSRFWFTLPLDR